jgi:hypothetical protein
LRLIRHGNFDISSYNDVLNVWWSLPKEKYLVCRASESYLFLLSFVWIVVLEMILIVEIILKRINVAWRERETQGKISGM